MADPSNPSHDSLDDRIEALLFECLEAEDANAALEQAVRDHPELGPALRAAYRELLRFDLANAPTHLDGGDEMPERLGDHRLIERLGAGGMGVVYLARDEVLQRTVALKLIRPEHLFMPGARERFQREVETIARLQHPGIVPIYGVAKANGVPFFTMQHINGCSLAHALHRLRAAKERDGHRLLEVVTTGADNTKSGSTARASGSGSESRGIEGRNWADTCVILAIQVASALHHAHERGVLHRDVKPSNILLTTDARAMLVDFGLAWSDDADQRLTMSNSQLGSLPYLPPEHIDGKASGPGRATDIYALGVTLYEMLTLHNPFLGKNGEETRRNILAAQPGRLRGENGISWELETVCMTAIDPDPSKRYRTMLAFQRDLERVLANESIEARRPSLARRARRWAQRHPTAMVAASVAVLSLLVALSVFVVEQRRLREIAEVERYAALVSHADIELRAGSRPMRARHLLEQCRADDRGWEWSHLEFATDQSSSEPRELDGPVQCLTFCPGGYGYVATTQNKTIVRCTAAGEVLWQRTGEATASVAIRSVGNHHELICGMLDGQLRALDLSTGEPIATYEGDADGSGREVTSIAISPDGTRVYSIATDGKVRAWDGERRTFLRVIGQHTTQGHRIALHPDGSRLATGGFDGKVRVFSLEDDQEIVHFDIGRWCLDLAWSPCGRRVLVTDGNYLKAYDIESPNAPPQVLDNQFTHVLAFDISPDRKLLAAAVARRVLHVYRFTSLEPLRVERISRMLGHEGLVQNIDFAFDSQHILTGSSDHTVRTWDPATCAEFSVRPHRRMIAEMLFVGDDTIVTADSLGNLCTSDHRGSWARLEPQPGIAAHDSAVVALLPADDGMTSIDEHGRVVHWRRNGGSLRPHETIETGLQPAAATVDREGSLIFGCAEGAVVVRGERELRWQAHDSRITALACTDRQLWTAAIDGHLRQWDVTTGTLVRDVHEHPGWISAMLVSPDGSWLATACADTVIRIFDTRTGALRQRCEGHGRTPLDLATDGTGSRLISSGGFDNELRFWQPASGRCLMSMGRPGAVTSLAFDARTGTLALGGRFGHLRLLRTRPGGPRKFTPRTIRLDTITSPPGQRRH